MELPLHPYQNKALEKFCDRGKLLVAYEQGTGKMQPVSEPVLTPFGWKPIGDLIPGDFVIGSNGLPTEVMGVFDQEDCRVYKITMNDGSWTLAGPEHVWTVWHSNDCFRKTGPRLLTTEQLLNKGLVNGTGERKWKIPMVAPVEFISEKPLIVDPYVLGAWLGDGNSDSGGFTSVDEEIISYIRTAGYEVTKKKDSSGLRPYGWYIKKLMVPLRELGVLNNKHIPEHYLRAGIKDRLALLQGLMDTDGYAQPTGGTEFCTTIPSIRDSIMDLAQGLGGIARVGKVKETGFKPAYRINIKLPKGMIPFRLSRKVNNWVAPTKYLVSRRIKSIEPWVEEESVCIQVAAEDQLYVTRNYIVTHNTPIGIACAETVPGTWLVVVPANLRIQWQQQIEKFLPGGGVVVVPGTPKKKRMECYDQITELFPKFVVMSYETVVNDARYIRRINPVGVILDECSFIKTFKSQRTKNVKKLLKAEYRIGLTGTPIENRPEELYSIMQWVDDSVLGRWDLFDKTYIEREFWGGVKEYKNLPVLYNRLEPAMVRARRADPDVKPYLPDEDYDVWYVDMSPELCHAYRRIAEDMLAELDNTNPSKFDTFDYYSGENLEEKFGPLGGMHVVAEMLLDHPDLVIISGQKYKEGKGGSKYAYDLWQDDVLDDVMESPKLTELSEAVDTILEYPENRVVVFTKFREFVPFIKAAINTETAEYHGGMSTKQKQEAIERFRTGPRVLISTHAGAYGVDMYMASHLLKLDLPFSYGKDSQINGRNARAASEFDKVYVRDFVTRNTIEVRNHQRIIWKRSISDAIVDNTYTSDSGAIKYSVESLRNNLEGALAMGLTTPRWHGKV